MLTIGCHLSNAKGFCHMGKEMLTIGANTAQFFTRNPRGGAAKAIDANDIEAFQALLAANGISVLLAHAPYTLNPCSADAHTREFAHLTMADDLKRLTYLPQSMYNFHPGSHVGQGVEAGIDLIVQLLNDVLTLEQPTLVLLETMSGKGTEIGTSFEQLREIISRVKLTEKIGVCLDTCHVYDAGYDIVNDLDGVLNHFDAVIGLSRLKAIHLNDSKNPFNSHKDRHELLGQGSIGLGTFKRIINHEKLKGVPFYLETPNALEGHAFEIATVKALYAE